MFVNVVAASLGASQSQRDGLTLMTEALSSVAAGKPTVVHTLFLLLQPKPFSAISRLCYNRLPNPKNLLYDRVGPCLSKNESLTH